MSAVKFDTLRSKAFGDITASYTVLGSVLAQNFRLMRIVNNTDGALLISTDGTTDKVFIPAYGFVLYDLATNAPNVKNSDSFVFAIGTQFYVKYSTAPTVGSVYLEGIYSTGV